MRVRTTVSVVTAILFLWILLVGCVGSSEKEYKLIRWPDGANDRYGIEVARQKGSDVVIPDVRSLQTTEQFVSGNAYWRYIDGFYSTAKGAPITNEFWFVLDKNKTYPKCLVISTNKESWIAWCASHNAPTNLVAVKEFVISRSSPKGGGAPKL
jgi:hypothetical protein